MEFEKVSVRGRWKVGRREIERKGTRGRDMKRGGRREMESKGKGRRKRCKRSEGKEVGEICKKRNGNRS